MKVGSVVTLARGVASPGVSPGALGVVREVKQGALKTKLFRVTFGDKTSIYFESELASAVVKVCSWCPNADQLTKDALDGGFAVTHGICAACRAKVQR